MNPTRLSKNICSVVGCQREAPPNGVMCHSHWLLTPMSMKTEIRRLYDPTTKRQSSELAAAAVRASCAARTADVRSHSVPSMRAITVWQPWAWAIVAGHKPVENRSWAPPEALVGEVLVIHAGKKFDFENEALVEQICGLDCLPPQADARGIIGVATLDRVIDAQDGTCEDPLLVSPWFSGRFGWVLRDADAFPTPIECQGKQGLWPVPPEVAEKVWYRMLVKEAMES